MEEKILQFITDIRDTELEQRTNNKWGLIGLGIAFTSTLIVVTLAILLTDFREYIFVNCVIALTFTLVLWAQNLENFAQHKKNINKIDTFMRRYRKKKK